MAIVLMDVKSSNPAVDVAVYRARRWSWVALAVAGLGLGVVAVGEAVGHPSPWSSWLLGTVLFTNPAVYLLSQRFQAFRAARFYYILAAFASVVAFIGMMTRLWHR